MEKEVVIDIKALQKLPEVATAQVLSYLKASALKRTLLLTSVKINLLVVLKDSLCAMCAAGSHGIGFLS